jgi:exopolysaccharide transport family protein
METTKEQDIDVRQYLRVLLKRRWVVISAFMLIVILTAIYSFTTVPVYQAKARIVIEKENPNLVSIQEVMAVDSTGTDYYQTQYNIIESRTVAREVIRRLNLDKSPEFLPESEDGMLSGLSEWFREKHRVWKDQISSLLNAEKNKGADRKSDDPSQDSPIVSAFISRIKVTPIRNSRLVDVSASAKDPVLAARMANEVVKVYIDQNMETKLLAAKEAVKWLTERIEDERKKVESAENALLQYKQEQGIITGFSNDAEKITAEKLAKLNNQVVEAESKRVETETRYQQALSLEKTPDLLDSIPEVLSNDIIKEIKKMEVNLYNKMSELSKKYGSNHPQMIAIQSELAELHQRKANEGKRIVSALRNEYRMSVAKEESLKKSFEEQKGESLNMNKKAIQYGVLYRQAESSKHMYELLIKRFKETSLTEEMKTGNIRVIDRAEIPGSPISPNKSRNTLLAAIIGLAMGVGLAFGLEYMDNSVKLPDEIKQYLGVPYLGPIPAFDANEQKYGAVRELITLHSPKSTPSESFRGIRTAVLFSSADVRPQVILVTSARPSEGKTLCAVNIAIAMAQSGSRTLIIDCDMRRPRVHKIFETGENKGLSAVLVGTCELGEAILPTGIENVDVLPSGAVPPNPSELLGSKRMDSIIQELKKRYDRIIIDSPPVTAVTDSVVVSSLVDGVILVIRTAETPRQVVYNAMMSLKAANARILGAVLNAVNIGRDSYYYYHNYYYYYGSGGKSKKQLKEAA